MKLICWNVRGLGSPRAVQRLRHLVKQHNPHVVFLMETKLDQKRMERVRRNCGFMNGIEVGADGSRGGLSLAWKEGAGITLRSFSKWHIDALVMGDDSRDKWRFTGWYGSPYARDQSQVWRILTRLSREANYPWLVAGDFIEIMYSFEKKGGLPREQRRMEIFKTTLEECVLTDIGYSGTWFTWERGNLPETNIRERLDRGVANDKWISLFPKVCIQHLPFAASDHCPLLINLRDVRILSRANRFHFEAWWTMEESFESVLKDIWESTSGELMEKLKILQGGLEQWAKALNRRGDIKKKITEELETLLMADRDEETLKKIIDKKIHLNMEIDKEEVYWEQRARVNWLQIGDKNTTYFHRSATTRHRANTISKLVLGDGIEVTDDAGLQEAAKDYFETNEALQSPFKEEEVRSALKGMGSVKAPGPDGFPTLFFQKYWHIVGKEVLDFCLGVLNEGKEIDSANMTDIVLIPKVSQPTSLVNFRPISLCTVIYKLVTKTIANRLQEVIGNCIDEAQSAFIPGRLIFDNILLAYEMLHTFRQKRTGKKGYMAVKLDMSKAYDRVEWNFVKQVMRKMGFADGWIDLIMKCITTASYAIIVNGSRGLSFQPSRGLRQGDPLSPFLFLICSEGLSALMRSAKTSGLIKGAKASRRGPAISHILFADDCILFGEATESGANILKEILKEYANCSGQCVNFDKTTVFYSTNTSAESKEVVSSLLGVRSSSNPEKYLGLPNMVGRKKKQAFQNLVDRIAARIEAWSSRLLSQGGKEIFIKSVLQAIPTYAISKDEGGLGFRNMTQFNISLLAKQGWRLLNCPDSLVAKVFKGKYFPDKNFLEARLGNSSSYVWRSIWATRDVLRKGMIWRVGTGQDISISEDAWIPNFINIRLMSRFNNLQSDKVAELINSNDREWNRELILNTFPGAVADLILRIPLASEPHADLMAWSGELSGEFSVRSSYQLLQNLDPTAYALQTSYRNCYKKLWQIDLPLKIKLFIWRLHLDLERFEDEEFSCWLTIILTSLAPKQGRIFCTALWAIWGERNTRMHESRSRSGQEIAKFVLSYLKELEGIKKSAQHTLTTNVKWRPPSGQGVTINFDAAFKASSRQSASGVVVRDQSGQVLLSVTKIHEGVESVFTAEALACNRATQVAFEMEKENITIEGDSLAIIKKCKTTTLDKSQIGSLIYDIQRMKQRCSKIQFQYIPRQANQLAHILATETLKRRSEIYLVHSVPRYAEAQMRDESMREPD
ncbi:reverse transcriptase [Gossypium australe]|uniref:Reverse transcriptase n=1 Tax=Gossypium australe TaxID=47621 RepID=A0A5B6UI00_9ROSI|nr:reverse transcriptase [Gossypium australe]